MSELVVKDGRHGQVDVVVEDVQVDRRRQGLEHVPPELETAAKQVPPPKERASGGWRPCCSPSTKSSGGGLSQFTVS